MITMHNNQKYIIIEQSQFDKKFKQTVSKKIPFIKAVKNSNDEWEWHIDSNDINLDNIDKIHEQLSTFPLDSVELLCNMIEYPMYYTKSFDDFFTDFQNDISSLSLPNKTYCLIGDVHHINSFSPSGRAPIYYCTIIDNHNLHKTVTAKIDTNKINLDNSFFHDIVDKRIEIKGKASIGQQIQLMVDVADIKILGECLRLHKLEEWENVCEYLSCEKKNKNINKITKIGLITSINTHGHNDFIKKLNNKYISSDNVICKYVTLKPKEIANAIEEFNKEDICQLICIIRGGGDAEELINFSHPILLHAIAASNIYVVTGIGHSSDNLLCDRIADKNADTPTGAANFINYLLARQNNQKSPPLSPPSKTDWKQKFLDLEKQTDELMECIDSLEKKVAFLTEQLEKKNKRGLLERILNH